MPLNYDTLNAITKKYYIPVLVDNIFKSNVLLFKLAQKGLKLDGGTKIVQPIVYAENANCGSYSGADTLLTTETEEATAFEFDWKQYYANAVITGKDEAINMGSEVQVMNFVASKMKIAEMTLKNKMATGLFSDGTGNGGKDITGLQLAVADNPTIGTYGGVDRATYAWARNQYDSATTVLTLAALQEMYGKCTEGNDQPDLIVTTQTIWNYIWRLVQPQQRYDEDKELTAVGFRNFKFNTAAVVVDSHVAANHIYFLNTKYVDLISHQARFFHLDPWIKPTNQDLSVAKILWMGNAAVSNPRMCGVMSAVASV